MGPASGTYLGRCLTLVRDSNIVRTDELRLGADDLWMARYILQRLCEDLATSVRDRIAQLFQEESECEEYQVGVTFDPKPVPKQAGIGCQRLGKLSDSSMLPLQLQYYRSYKLLQHGYPQQPRTKDSVVLFC